jgi:hypothetical protein
MTQQSFWGMDDQGNTKNSGHRIVYVFSDAVRKKLKIGFTTRDGMKRMKAQQTGNPDRLEFVGSFVVRDDQDDRDYHKMFARFHYCGGGGDEWFDDVPELRAALMRLIRQPHIFRIPKRELEPPTNPNHYRECQFKLGCPCGNVLWWVWDFQKLGAALNGAPPPTSFKAICRECGRASYVEYEYVSESE